MIHNLSEPFLSDKDFSLVVGFSDWFKINESEIKAEYSAHPEFQENFSLKEFGLECFFEQRIE